MSDPRLPDIERAARRLPAGSTLIYRHFGDKRASHVAANLRQISFARDLQFLIGQDAALAIKCGADGLHLPQSYIADAALWRARCPNWIITAATHDAASLASAQDQPLDAITLSPVFKSASPSAKTLLGLEAFTALTQKSPLPVFALGGINKATGGALLGSGAAGVAGVSGILD